MATCYSPFLDHLQANIYLYKVLRVGIIHSICLQTVSKNNYKSYLRLKHCSKTHYLNITQVPSLLFVNIIYRFIYITPCSTVF